MSTIQEKVTVEQVTQWGIRSGGKNYGISPRLKEAGIEPKNFDIGTTYDLEIYVGSKGGKSINSFVKLGGAVDGSVQQLQRNAQPLPPPALPSTTVTETKAPGGVPPVAPAQKRTPSSNTSNDTMTKEDWDRKSFLIHVDAIMKSTLESPALAQLVVGKRLEEAQATKREWFKSSLKDYDDAVNGML